MDKTFQILKLLCLNRAVPAVAVLCRPCNRVRNSRRRRSLMLALAGMLVFAPGATVADGSQGRLRLEQFLNQMTTFRAHFEQRLFDEYGGLLETATGEVAISKPGKFRWEYQQPYGQLIVTDGKTLWVYDIDLEQVSINPFTHGGAGSPAELLVGEVDLEQDYLIAESIGDDGTVWVSLTPHDETAQYNVIDIGLDDAGIRAMKLHDNLNQLTEIHFDEIVRDGEIGGEYFDFVPPPGVDVMTGAVN